MTPHAFASSRAKIYSIGYQRLTPPDIVSLVDKLDATVIDVRIRPTSRKPGWGRRQLESLLGIRYQWRGDELGGQVFGNHGPTQAGIQRLVDEAGSGAHLILMCLEENPLSCHRHHLIALPLSQRGIPVHHIVGEEILVITSHRRRHTVAGYHIGDFIR
jgi:uncharacterized protein (DUF488 family)